MNEIRESFNIAYNNTGFINNVNSDLVELDTDPSNNNNFYTNENNRDNYMNISDGAEEV